MHPYLKKFFSGDSRSVAVKKNIIGSLLVKGISIVVSLMLVPMTLGYVSSEVYGIWLTLSSIMMWLNFFDVGFTLGLKNKLAESLALKDVKRGKSLVSTTYFMMGLIFVPLCIVLVLLAPHVDWPSLLNVNPEYNEAIVKAMYVLSVCFCCQMMVNVLTAVISAHQEVALSSVFPVVGNILSLVVIAVMTQILPPSLPALAWAISAMPVIVLVVASLILYSKRYRLVSPSFSCINKAYVKDLFGLGVKFFLIQIQVIVLYQSTNILISNVAGPNEVTQYNIAYKYLGVAMMLYTIILSPLWPAFTDAYAKEDFGWMKRVYRKMAKVYAVSVAVLAVMVIASPFVYRIWIGDKVDIPMVMTLCVAVYMAVHSWDALQVQQINGIGKIGLQTSVTLIGLAVHIP